MNKAQSEFDAFDKAIGEATTADEVWTAIHALSDATVGGRLFSVMLCDWRTKVNSRAYSSHPKEYPVSGTKPFNPTHWWDVIHSERKPFVANSLKEIAEVFPDAEFIGSLGLGSVINVPVVLENQIAGTLNLLDEENFYTAERIEAAARLMLPGKTAILAAAALQ